MSLLQFDFGDFPDRVRIYNTNHVTLLGKGMELIYEGSWEWIVNSTHPWIAGDYIMEEENDWLDQTPQFLLEYSEPGPEIEMASPTASYMEVLSQPAVDPTPPPAINSAPAVIATSTPPAVPAENAESQPNATTPILPEPTVYVHVEEPSNSSKHNSSKAQALDEAIPDSSTSSEPIVHPEGSSTSPLRSSALETPTCPSQPYLADMSSDEESKKSASKARELSPLQNLPTLNSFESVGSSAIHKRRSKRVSFLLDPDPPRRRKRHSERADHCTEEEEKRLEIYERKKEGRRARYDPMGISDRRGQDRNSQKTERSYRTVGSSKSLHEFLVSSQVSPLPVSAIIFGDKLPSYESLDSYQAVTHPDTSSPSYYARPSTPHPHSLSSSLSHDPSAFPEESSLQQQFSPPHTPPRSPRKSSSVRRNRQSSSAMQGGIDQRLCDTEKTERELQPLREEQKNSKPKEKMEPVERLQRDAHEDTIPSSNSCRTNLHADSDQETVTEAWNFNALADALPSSIPSDEASAGTTDKPSLISKIRQRLQSLSWQHLQRPFLHLKL
ncbi:hypothetical protein H0H92_003362 [Tricholoma furcatifolium]|nr:hypothetical protein H0H92_003362 [Tricholoma furcatifolium]